jgi:hypothetical protein
MAARMAAAAAAMDPDWRLPLLGVVVADEVDCEEVDEEPVVLDPDEVVVAAPPDPVPVGLVTLEIVDVSRESCELGIPLPAPGLPPFNVAVVGALPAGLD